ncbi:DUF3224 domain-containing protein [Lysobacter sp. Root604]|uniref:DUF3224 domain-containing protein n=1 Tax=Lysobacter sp. Root604 TaxID=1736568 RepID=UPI0007018AD7|nr:DUF3224 domain-containing protein [Lysobacter sp. Root604]KRA16287.1 hypothetical protein ASD69_16340 [Lysobacter sp. Root604]
MSTRIRGVFDVEMIPQPADDAAAGRYIGRMRLDKRYHGELDAGGQGQMLAFRSGVAGSAGYVAMERVEGRLAGRSGSFVLQHSAIMDRGTPALALRVVPDSGDDELSGLSGTMTIEIADGKHYYDFDYTLPTEP